MKSFPCLLIGLVVLGTTFPVIAKPKEALWGAPIQTNPKTNSKNTPKSKASELGGTIVPTQSPLTTPSTGEPSPSQAKPGSVTFVLEPLRPVSSAPPAPMITDPPKPSGAGFIRVETP